jgi:hypothetical protein
MESEDETYVQAATVLTAIAQVLRWESLASRVTPLPQDDKRPSGFAGVSRFPGEFFGEL